MYRCLDAAIKAKCDLAIYKNFKADRIFGAITEAIIYHDCPKYPDYESCKFPLVKVTDFAIYLQPLQMIMNSNVIFNSMSNSKVITDLKMITNSKLGDTSPVYSQVSSLIANQRPDDHKSLFDYKVLLLSGAALLVVLLVVGAVVYKFVRTGFHKVSTAEV